MNDDDVGLPNGSGSPVAIVSYDFWQHRFGGDARLLGNEVLIAGAPFTVIGVTPKGFFGEQVGYSLDVTLPITQRSDRTSNRNDDLFCQYLIGRLQDGVTIDQARGQLAAIWPGIRSGTLPSNLSGRSREQFLSHRIRIDSYPTNGFSFLREQFSMPLGALMAIAALVLLIACLNLATLQLARASVRQRDVNTRLALGAARWQIVQQSFAESSLLCIPGAAIGVGFAYWATSGLLHFWNTGIATVLDVQPDLRVIGFTIAISVLTATIVGFVPAWHVCYRPPNGALKDVASRGLWRLGRVLIVAQVALSVVAVTSGALLVRSLTKLRAVQPGFGRDHVLAVELQPTVADKRKPADRDYCMTLVQRLSDIPGVRSVALSHMVPGAGMGGTEQVSASGAESSTGVAASFQMVSPDFFRTMSIGLMVGRVFRWDDDAHAARTAIVSRSLAQQLFPSGDAIGQRIRIGADPQRQQAEIVGIANDTRLPDIRQPWPFIVYVSYVQEPLYMNAWTDVELLVADRSPQLVDAVRREAESLGREYVRRSWTLDEVIDNTVVNERVLAVVSGFFANLSLLLAAIGLTGLLTYSVRQRTREIGIRMALGAQRGAVVWMVLRETLVLIALGFCIGLPSALAATRFMAHLLLDLSPHDPVTLALVTGQLFAVGLLGGLLPARSAANSDPINALRSE